MTTEKLRSSAAVGLRLGVRFKLLEVGPDLRAVNGIEFRVGLARLRRLIELHEGLPEIEQAIRGAVPARVLAIIGKQRLGRRARIALVELGAADEVVSVTDATMLGIG